MVVIRLKMTNVDQVWRVNPKKAEPENVWKQTNTRTEE